MNSNTDLNVENASAAPDDDALAQEKYVDWTPRSLADPRVAKIPQFHDGLKAIVETEGPINAYRAYQIFGRAADLNKLSAATKARFDHALQRALEEGMFLTEEAYPSEKAGVELSVSDLFLRLPDQPISRVRTLGSRNINDVCPSELAEVILHVRTQDDLLGRDEIYREVLAIYGLQKITGLARRTFDHVLKEFF
ncbi:MAG: hypothetical protein ACPGVN_05145 [Alphaproteobacteria bacterium]